MTNIKVIAFDADDTLWVNETYFRDAENEFAKLLSGYETENKIHQELYKKEIDNLKIYGYGVKGFVLSMVECALEISNNKVNQNTINKILEIGKEMLEQPIDLLDGVEEVLQKLQGKYKLIVATKGDLLDQERKLEKSGILKYFHHTEVMSDKKDKDYLKLIKHLDIDPSELLMIGNSLKSDVLPLVKIGASAIHIPFHTTWAHEEVSEEQKSDNYKTVSKITDVLNFL
ncbi:HAD family hydrolase [Tenacibaculum soleae]|uniref:HAD family hydrolase n=1 Tax=Tenacibaculum soleae TaxID=447689 RepID=A0A1B9XZ53_9FLAO|nr:HAD family hydrolase [Tenacibaculum soleae]MDO6812104.1 HAD family hydrolase [Tenacibaculum soleae]OCK42812.1 HAD family hydrolase [Tenacibaculum soleae]